MTSQSQTMLENGLFSILVICAAVAVFVCVLAVGTLTTLFPFKTVEWEGMSGEICNTSVRCVTVPKRQKRTLPEPRVIESSPKLMASLSPKEGNPSEGPSQKQPSPLGTLVKTADLGAAPSSLIERMMQINDIEFP
jgi:hypothetical protein